MKKTLAIWSAWAIVWSSFALVDGVLYEVLLNSFEAIPQELDDILDYGTIRLTRQGKNQLGVSGSFSILQNAGSETQQMFINGRGSLCEIVAKDEVIYPHLLESSNLPPQDSCPFPKGNYTIYNYVMDEQRLPPAVPASEWIIETLLSRDGKIGAGFRINFTTK
uniref:MD-2-related lipid-recognition domain-containing protein n=1 Tax=Anopheles culicifacies TaxID=139723 RepID=A0A182MTH5_9DIPT